jgi:large subunit ribosomal protein L30e
MINVDKAISTAVRTGKALFGSDEAIRSTKNGKAKLIVLASNAPPQIQESLKYYGSLSQIPIVAYRGNNIDLGMACGKPFAVSALTVKEVGDSEILKLVEKPEAEHPPIENEDEV